MVEPCRRTWKVSRGRKAKTEQGSGEVSGTRAHTLENARKRGGVAHARPLLRFALGDGASFHALRRAVSCLVSSTRTRPASVTCVSRPSAGFSAASAGSAMPTRERNPAMRAAARARSSRCSLSSLCAALPAAVGRVSADIKSSSVRVRRPRRSGTGGFVRTDGFVRGDGSASDVGPRIAGGSAVGLPALSRLCWSLSATDCATALKRVSSSSEGLSAEVATLSARRAATRAWLNWPRNS